MSLAKKLMQAYFDFAYNPVYDFTTGRLNLYQQLQRRCIGKLELKDNDNVLCAGCGTGNEIFHILKMNRNVHIVGVDYSRTALRKARKKALSLEKEIETFVMDVRHLEFAAGSFDKLLCLHVMDFVADSREATHEILRVLKNGGQFVITYPSGKEGPRLGVNLLSDSVRHGISSGTHCIRTLFESLPQMLVSTVYLPLLLRPKRKAYCLSELETLISRLTGDFEIEEDVVYQDFIVYGRKSIKGGKSNAC